MTKGHDGDMGNEVRIKYTCGRCGARVEGTASAIAWNSPPPKAIVLDGDRVRMPGSSGGDDAWLDLGTLVAPHTCPRRSRV